MITVPAILLAMTAVSGIVDAVCFIALGHVFTANMTGNVVFLGFAIGGVPGLSIWRSLLALVFFMSGALLGGWMTKAMNPQDPGSTPVYALVIETVLLLAASVVSIGFRAPYEDHKLKIALVAQRRGAKTRRTRPDHDRADADHRWVCCRLKPCGGEQPAVGETCHGSFGDAHRGDRRHFDARLFRGGTAVRFRRHDRDLRASAPVS